MKTPQKTVREEMFSPKRKTLTKLIILISILLLLLNPIFGAVAFLVYVGFIKAILHKDFISRFAKNNNFIFEEKMNVADLENLNARLFRYGRSPRAYNVMTKKDKDSNYPIQIFNFSCVVGSGKNSQALLFTVAKTEFEKTNFPHIFLKSEKMRKHSSTDFFGIDKDVKISLEKEFEDSFDLYCTQDYEIEVLQIFTKEVLEDLTKFQNKFSIEFAKNKIYVYRDKTLKKEEGILELLSIVDKILEKAGPLINRLHDDFGTINEAYGK